MEFKGKTAIVTGGASGLGRATVEYFVSKGANAVILDLNDEMGHELAGKLGDAATAVRFRALDFACARPYAAPQHFRFGDFRWNLRVKPRL